MFTFLNDLCFVILRANYKKRGLHLAYSQSCLNPPRPCCIVDATSYSSQGLSMFTLLTDLCVVILRAWYRKRGHHDLCIKLTMFTLLNDCCVFILRANYRKRGLLDLCDVILSMLTLLNDLCVVILRARYWKGGLIDLCIQLRMFTLLDDLCVVILSVVILRASYRKRGLIDFFTLLNEWVCIARIDRSNRSEPLTTLPSVRGKGKHCQNGPDITTA